MPGPLIQALPVPWWADPAKASVTDPLSITLVRKAAGLMGVGGDPGTAVLGAAGGPLTGVGEAPEGLVQSLLKYQPTQQSGPTAKLLGLLSKFSGKSPVNPLPETVGGSIPTNVGARTMFSRALTRVPEAQGVLEMPKDLGQQRPPGFASLYGKEAAFRQRMTPSPEESWTRDMLKGVYDRPSIKSLDELKDVAASTPSQSYEAPPPTSAPSNLRAQRMRSSLTENDIRNIRSLGLNAAVTQYRTIPRDTLRGIVSRDVYNWVKD